MKNKYILIISAFVISCCLYNQQTLPAQDRITVSEERVTRDITRPTDEVIGAGAVREATDIVSDRIDDERYIGRYDGDRVVRRYVRPVRRSYYGRPYRRGYYYSRPYRSRYRRNYYDDGYYYRDRTGDVLGGAATGALIGGVAGGGRGAAIGAGVGAGIGLLP